MNIEVISNSRALTAAITARIEKEGFTVAAKTPRKRKTAVANITETIAIDSDPSLTRGTVVIETTTEAFQKVHELDKSFIGTCNYMGLAYFWGYDYRHYLRDATPVARCVVHDAILRAGLPLDGESKQHLSIITRELDALKSHV